MTPNTQKRTFLLGRIVTTPIVDQLVQDGTFDPIHYLRRHMSGDWGDVSDDDRQANDSALEQGDRLVSSYKISDSLTLLVITEQDRSATTLMLPSDY